MYSKFTAEPNWLWVNYKGAKTSDKSAVSSQAQDELKSQSTKVKNSYMRELMKAYQKKIDLTYGIYNAEEKLYIYDFKPKKFDYSDLNEASKKFIEITSDPDYYNSESIAKIKEIIAVWEKAVTEYKPGKSSRISDKNIDELYLNLCYGYLALGDHENTEKWWNKCTSYKGNSMTEGFAQLYIVPQIKNGYNYVKSTESSEGRAFQLFSEQKLNKLVFFNVIFSNYLSEKNGNLSIIQNYFPSNEMFIKTAVRRNDYDEGTKEVLRYYYNGLGQIQNLEYSLDGSINTNGTWTYTFNYQGEKLQEVYLNERKLLWTLSYNGDKLISVKYHRSADMQVEYKVNYTGDNKINFGLVIIQNGTPKESRSRQELTYNDKLQLGSYIFDYKSAKKMVYDSGNNLVKYSKENHDSQLVDLEFHVEQDSYGNASLRTYQESKETFEAEYIL